MQIKVIANVFKSIGTELEKEYFQIAQKRLKHY